MGGICWLHDHLVAAGEFALLAARKAERPWPIYYLGESELIAGRDNKHLDFRLSIHTHKSGQATFATVSTVCRAHNQFGRVYLRVIAPFHKWGVKRLLARAVSAGRL